MLIISNFKDYYDAALYTGIDKKLVYRRFTDSIDNVHFDINSIYSYGCLDRINVSNITSVTFAFGEIIFCGKTYKFIEVTTTKNWYDDKIHSYSYFYNLEDLVSKYPKVQKRLDRGQNYYYNRDPREWLNEKVPDRRIEMLDKKLPIVATEQYRIVKNPPLADYEFWKVMDCMHTFQELSMFIGAMQNREELVDIDDEHKARGKGFDCYSFKKEPTKRKRKQCRRK